MSDHEHSAEMRRMLDLFSRKEDLHPDLVPHMRDDGPVGPMLHHPLIINVLHTEHDNARTNEQYRLKKAEVEKAAQEQNWHRFVFWHERPYRLNALVEVLGKGVKLDPQTYWELVASIWTDSENIYESYGAWVAIWSADVANRKLAMSDEERAYLASLPDTIQVWRGVGHRPAINGMSWTVDEEKARWFAKRYGSHGGRSAHLVSGTVNKADVLAYFSGRNESELVVFPKDVKNKKVEKL